MKQAIASRGRTRRAAIVAASLSVHAVVLLFLGRTAPSQPLARMSEPTFVSLEIWPSSRSPVRRPAPRKVRATAAAFSPRRAAVLDPAANPPAPRSPLPAQQASAAIAPAPEPSAPAGGDPRGALRGSTVGCANRDAVGLTRRERETCDDRFAKGRENDPFIDPPIEAGKRAAWDAEAARKARIRKRKEAPPPPGVDPSDNAGGTRTNGLGILGY